MPQDLFWNIVKEMTKRLERMELSQAAEWIYEWFWHGYCDKYIEFAKNGLISKKLMRETLEINLKLLHPFMPFVTEHVWHEMGNKNLLIASEWPK